MSDGTKVFLCMLNLAGCFIALLMMVFFWASLRKDWRGSSYMLNYVFFLFPLISTITMGALFRIFRRKRIVADERSIGRFLIILLVLQSLTIPGCIIGVFIF